MSIRQIALGLLTALLPFFTPPAAGATPSAEDLAAQKRVYHLFNPTPADLMRDLSTDRPDQTESAYTVDAGHVQIEIDFLNYLREHDTVGGADVRTRALAVAPLNLKLGLLNNVDLQLMADPYIRVRAEDRLDGVTARASGFGDFTTRLKVNLWGNDGGPTALAIMPFVKWPLKASDLRNGETEGGIIVPLSVELGAGWVMGAMTELDFVRNETNTGHDREWLNSIAFGHGITETLGGYGEFVAISSSAAGSKWAGYFAMGLTYAWSPNLQFDAGCNFGVKDAAADFNPFFGVSYRY